MRLIIALLLSLVTVFTAENANADASYFISKECMEFSVRDERDKLDMCSKAMVNSLGKLAGLFLKEVPRLSPDEENWYDVEIASESEDRMMKAAFSSVGVRMFYLQKAENVSFASSNYLNSTTRGQKIFYLSKLLLDIDALVTSAEDGRLEEILSTTPQLAENILISKERTCKKDKCSSSEISDDVRIKMKMFTRRPLMELIMWEAQLLNAGEMIEEKK